MKKIIFLILLVQTLSFGQFKKIVLMEVATNSGCNTCAGANELVDEFYENYYGGIISVRYHPNFPDPSDPMFNDNPVDNSGRVDYYNILYTPQYVMNGKLKGGPVDQEVMWNQMNEETTETPIWINVHSIATQDSINFTVEIISTENIVNDNLYLKTSITQRMVSYESPPGSNGETDFASVMRKMLPDFTGTKITSITNSDTLRFSFNSAIEENWDWKNLEVIAWLQNDDTKEILQANSSLPVVRIESNQSDYSVVTNGTILVVNEYSITNHYSESISFYLKTKIFQTSDDISIQIIDTNGNEIDSSIFTLESNDTLNFQANISYLNPQSLAHFDLFCSNLENAMPYKFRYSFLTFSEDYETLIIDKSNSNSIQGKLVPSLNLLELKYAITNSFVIQHWKNLFLYYPPKSVMLFSGDFYPQYKKSEIEFILDYLDNNSNVIITGNKISSSRSDFTSSIYFYDNYLDAEFVSNTNIAEIVGTTTNPLSQNLYFQLKDASSISSEIIKSKTGNSQNFLYYYGDTYSQSAGLFNETDSTKIIFYPFDISRISEQTKIDTVLRNAYSWFEIISDLENIGDDAPNNYKLYQNYPNPFSAKTTTGGNPTTIIRFSIPNTSVKASGSAYGEVKVPRNDNVRLIVYNSLGQQVAELLNKPLSPGNYQVEFKASSSPSVDGRRIPSGIYFYRLQSGAFAETKKMILIK